MNPLKSLCAKAVAVVAVAAAGAVAQQPTMLYQGDGAAVYGTQDFSGADGYGGSFDGGSFDGGSFDGGDDSQFGVGELFESMPDESEAEDEAFGLQEFLFGTPAVDPCTCEPGRRPFTFSGWFQGGYHTNSNGLFNSHPDRFNLHQAYLILERVADGSDGLDFGFRFDAVYGVDAQDTQVFNSSPNTFDNDFDNGIYGWALPQAYAEVAAGDLSVKFGHFYTLVGYEVVTAPDNFFYSHAYTQYLNEPFTHTGALASYAVSDNTTLYGGWVDGWDTGFEFSGGNQFLGGISQALGENSTLTYILVAGDREETAVSNPGSGYNHSIVLDTQIGDRLQYVFQTDYSDYDRQGFHAYGINQYLFYDLSDSWRAGLRGEWFHVANFGDDQDSYQVTGGLNYRPNGNVVVRPEVRYDFGDRQFFDDIDSGTFEDVTFGIDVILTF